MPGLVKIGMTNKESVDARLKELFNTCVPVPFECAYICKEENEEKVEMMRNGIGSLFGGFGLR